MSAPVVLHTVTDTKGTAHLVTDDAMVAGRPAGRYAAVCGTKVVPASLTVLESSYCRTCWRGGRP